MRHHLMVWQTEDTRPIPKRRHYQFPWSQVKSKKNDCSGEGKAEPDHVTTDLIFKNVCLNERLIGEDYHYRTSTFCTEQYLRLYGKWEIDIYCNHPKIYLKPNGSYQYAQIAFTLGNVPLGNIHVEVGKCSMIAP